MTTQNGLRYTKYCAFWSHKILHAVPLTLMVSCVPKASIARERIKQKPSLKWIQIELMAVIWYNVLVATILCFYFYDSITWHDAILAWLNFVQAKTSGLGYHALSSFKRFSNSTILKFTFNTCRNGDVLPHWGSDLPYWMHNLPYPECALPCHVRYILHLALGLACPHGMDNHLANNVRALSCWTHAPEAYSAQ